MTKHESNPSLDQGALLEMVQGTVAETGELFFDQLVKHLARALNTKCAWVTEWLAEERRLRALSFWVDDGYFGDYEYDIVNTPCETVIDEQQLIHVPDRLLELYAGDPDLEPLGAVSYMGVALFDTDGRILGHLAILHDQPLPEDPKATAIFNIFASRAAAELRRLRRDRDLREREHKLSLLIDSAMDAIIEIDGDLEITNLNSAAERVFGCAAANVIGTTFNVFLAPEAREKLARLIAQLEKESQDTKSMWIPDDIEAVRAGGQKFPAEATLSRFELAGQPYYTFILRNLDERLEAEERIRSLVSETAYLRSEIDALQGFADIIGESDALKRVLADVKQVASGDTTVLITGATGTGKELIARAIHRRSSRALRQLIKVNCAAIPANLQESEFFGHEKGAFTGATKRREGRFKLADGGTIFLDEVGELPLDLQAKLLRVLQEGEYEPVGGSKTDQVDVRVIAATNRNLEQMVEQGSFRKDLLYRLNVFPLQIPPLRERGDDIILLAEAFAQRIASQNGRTVASLTDACKARLKRYDWPGNVRELQNVIERAFITSQDGRRLNFDRALPDAMIETGAERGNASVPSPHPADSVLTAAEIREFERNNLIRALEEANWKISGAGGAASKLGLNPNTLSSRMKSLGIQRHRPNRTRCDRS